ncbi:MAG: hypothetical protein LH479_13130 [Polaromonas sp.]|nr:hypothetical protein [Polaromonas sp.]
MKYLLVLGLVLVVFWAWRSARDRRAASLRQADKPAPVPVQTEIVECDLCHLHLPRPDALIGATGTFCSDAHRVQAGREA